MFCQNMQIKIWEILYLATIFWLLSIFNSFVNNHEENRDEYNGVHCSVKPFQRNTEDP